MCQLLDCGEAAHLHDGEGVEGEVGDGEDEGGREEELGEVVEESPEEGKHLLCSRRKLAAHYGVKGLAGTWSKRS